LLALRNTQTHYGVIARVLHWTTVALVFLAIMMAVQSSALEVGPKKLAALTKHAVLGLAILSIMLVRLYWRTVNVNPIDSYTLPRPYKILAMSLHRGIYCLILALALTGILHVVFLGNSLPVAGRLGLGSFASENAPVAELWHDIHVQFTYVLYAVIGLHVLGAIVHGIFGVRDDPSS
jgi:cytochrome b561